MGIQILSSRLQWGKFRQRKCRNSRARKQASGRKAGASSRTPHSPKGASGRTLAGNSFCAAKAAPLWARPRARRKLLFPLPGERGSRRALLPAGASRVRGYFFPFSFTVPIASTTFRTNSSGHFLPAGNRRPEGEDLFLPVGNSAKILLTTYLVSALALEGRLKGR